MSQAPGREGCRQCATATPGQGLVWAVPVTKTSLIASANVICTEDGVVTIGTRFCPVVGQLLFMPVQCSLQFHTALLSWIPLLALVGLPIFNPVKGRTHATDLSRSDTMNNYAYWKEDKQPVFAHVIRF
jgi:hypothetical protein